MPYVSFGYRCVLESHGELRGEMRELPSEIKQKGTVDDIAIELEALNLGNARTIRTTALKQLGEKLRRNHKTAYDAIYDIQSKDYKLALWMVSACVRKSAALVENQEPRECVELVEAFIGGEDYKDVTLPQMLKIIRERWKYSDAPVDREANYAGLTLIESAMNKNTPDRVSLYAINAIALNDLGVKSEYDRREGFDLIRILTEMQLLKDIVKAMPGYPIQ